MRNCPNSEPQRPRNKNCNPIEYKGMTVFFQFHYNSINCINGNEKDPTLLWQMNVNNKFHIDYCFVSENYKIKSVNVGSLIEWKENKLSDHCPLIIEIE